MYERLHVCLYTVRMPDIWRGCHIPWNWSYKYLWATWLGASDHTWVFYQEQEDDS